MTIDEFLDELAQTPRKWRLRNHDGAIRMGHCCPITAVFKRKRAAEALECADLLDLRPSDAVAIMTASDYTRFKDTPKISMWQRGLRKEILEACGLK